jgi:Serine dehydrogenase proteinase
MGPRVWASKSVPTHTVTADTPPSPGWLDVVLAMRRRRVAAIAKLEAMRNSIVFVFWNLDDLKREDFFTLADFLEEENPQKDIDLVVVSPGGNGEAGYRIGHSFQQWASRNSIAFRVLVPLYAKSAATILALGADEIVMGLHSEIGPIDPQILKYDRLREGWRYVPALAVMDGLKLIGEHIEKLPEMSKFFEELLSKERLSLDELGLVERARESGKQYGELLLMGSMLKDEKAARTTVERLTDYYKFHGHPIDAFDAEQHLHLQVAHCSGQEWKAIKEVRDEYQAFVGQPDIIPGIVVTSAIESNGLRSWRHVALETSTRERLMFLPGRDNDVYR